MSEKYFWRSGGEDCFSLDIPFYRTSECAVTRAEPVFGFWGGIRPGSSRVGCPVALV
jgi:hypothetical protein